MKIHTCCFSGHRIIPDEDINSIILKLEKNIDTLYKKDVTRYLVGGALGFDTIAAEAVLNYKKNHPDIYLELIIPYSGHKKSWSKENKLRYEYIKNSADKVICLSDHYFQGCMHVRNRFLVDNSSFCICYLTQKTGGTVYTAEYAEAKGLKVINLADN